MSDQVPEYSPLSPEQLEALTDSQKQIFTQLDEKDRQFFAGNFSPTSLGQALERKWESVQSRARLEAFDQRVKENLTAAGTQATDKPGLTGGDVALGAAGVAGAVGIGVLARKIAPEGKATWRGVTPRDLVDPLVNTFARQEKTDIRFQSPTSEGLIQGSVLLRTSGGLVPGLTIVLTPFKDATQVEISKVSSDSIMQAVKEGGQKLINLVQQGLHLGRGRGGADMLDMADDLFRTGVDIAQIVKDLDLEDKAWEAIQKVADPLQAVYDEKMAIENEERLKLEMAWDDYYSCPKCRVNFGADDAECRVCGSARPSKPDQPDPRSV